MCVRERTSTESERVSEREREEERQAIAHAIQATAHIIADAIAHSYRLAHISQAMAYIPVLKLSLSYS